MWTCMPCEERITIVEPRADYILPRLLFCCFSEERMWRRARMWKYGALQISETCSSKDIINESLYDT